MEVAQNPAHGQRARMMDALTALRLQIEWGADEALEAAPVNRLRPPPTRVPAVSSASSVASSPASSALATKATGRRDAARVTPAERAARAAAAATTLEELRAAIAGFDGSALRDTATNLVFLEGTPRAACCW